jgi:hypothetical protein
MLVFVDESGDLGFRFDRGSTPYFTIALIVFETTEAALECEHSIMGLRAKLEVPDRYEFHFHQDAHERRLQMLSVVGRQDFYCYTFTLNTQSPRLIGRGLHQKDSAYKWVSRAILENVADDLKDATIVLDGSGSREFRKQMQTYLRRELNTPMRERITKVKTSRSTSDALLQLADYVAGVTNRLYEQKAGAETYDSFLRRKRRSQRLWP